MNKMSKSQSHHSGIETFRFCLVATIPSQSRNRTIVGLKQNQEEQQIYHIHLVAIAP